MALYDLAYVTEILQPRSGTILPREITHRRVFRVVTLDPDHNAHHIRLGEAPPGGFGQTPEGESPLARIPEWGEMHPNDRFCRVRELQFEQWSPDEAGLQWRVTADYSSSTESDEDVNVLNPLEERALRYFDFVEGVEPLEYDAVTGEPVLNTAGDPLKIEVPVYYTLMSIERTEAAINPALNAQVVGSINQSTFFDYAPQTCRMTAIRPRESYNAAVPINGGYYWRTTYEIEVHPSGWNNKEFLSLGFGHIRNGKYEIIVDANGNTLSEPGGLDENGLYVRDGLAPGEPSREIASLVYNRFRVSDFGVYNLEAEF